MKKSSFQKRAMALFCTLVMLFSLMTTAFAAEDYEDNTAPAAVGSEVPADGGNAAEGAEPAGNDESVENAETVAAEAPAADEYAPEVAPAADGAEDAVTVAVDAGTLTLNSAAGTYSLTKTDSSVETGTYTVVSDGVYSLTPDGGEAYQVTVSGVGTPAGGEENEVTVKLSDDSANVTLSFDEDTYIVTLTADEHYDLPETVTVTFDGTETTSYTYDRTGGTIVFSADTLADVEEVTVSAKGTEKCVKVELNSENVTLNEDSDYLQKDDGGNLWFFYTRENAAIELISKHYDIPESSITVKVNGTATEGYSYTEREKIYEETAGTISEFSDLTSGDVIGIEIDESKTAEHDYITVQLDSTTSPKAELVSDKWYYSEWSKEDESIYPGVDNWYYIDAIYFTVDSPYKLYYKDFCCKLYRDGTVTETWQNSGKLIDTILVDANHNCISLEVKSDFQPGDVLLISNATTKIDGDNNDKPTLTVTPESADGAVIRGEDYIIGVNHDSTVTFTFSVADDDFDIRSTEYKTELEPDKVCSYTLKVDDWTYVTDLDAKYITWSEDGKTAVITFRTGDETKIYNDAGELLLGEGEHSVTFQVKDAFGGENEPPVTCPKIIVDNSAPVVNCTVTGASQANDSYYTTGTATLKFDVTDNQFDPTYIYNEKNSYDVQVNGQSITSGYAWDGTTLTMENYDFGAEGSYTVTLSVTDMAENTTNTSAEIIVDNTAPTVACTVTGANHVDEAYYTTGKATLEFAVTDDHFEPTCDEVKYYDVQVNGQSITSGYAWDGTTLTMDDYDFGAEGSYKVTVSVTDLAGNKKTFTSDEIVVDKTAPTVACTITGANQADDSYYTTGTATLKFAVTDDHFEPTCDEVKYYDVQVNDKSITSGYAWEGTTLTMDDYDFGVEGSYKVTVSVTDLAGNKKTFTSDEIVVDKTAPTITASCTVTGEKKFSDGTYYINGTDTATLTFTVTDNNFDGRRTDYTAYTATKNSESVTMNWSDAKTGILKITSGTDSDGTYNTTLQVTDLAGNTSEICSGDKVVVDNAPPVISNITYTTENIAQMQKNIWKTIWYAIFGLRDDEESAYAVTGTFTVTDTSPMQSVTMTDSNGNSIALSTTDVEGEYSFTISSEVEEQYKVTATDIVNNQTTMTAKKNDEGEWENDNTNVLVDVQKPVITCRIENADYNDGTRYFINGTTAAAVVFTVSDNHFDNGLIKGEGERTTQVVTYPNYWMNVNGWGVGKSLTWASANSGSMTIQSGANYAGDMSYGEEDYQVELIADDIAGNEGRVTSPTLVIDQTAPNVSFNAPDYTTVHSIDYALGFRAADIPADSDSDVPTSGIKEISYRILVKGNESSSGTLSVSTSGNYTITIPASLNSNLVQVEVTAVDNVGNTATYTTENFKMDNEAPVVTVVYNNNTADSSKYFNAPRTATVTVTDNNVIANGITVNSEVSLVQSSLSDTDNDGVSDTYIGTLTYSADADYTLSISAADAGGNSVSDNSSMYTGQTAPQDFTIDQTAPTFEVGISYIGDDGTTGTVTNGGYAPGAATYTLTITEHNFDSSRVTVYLNGQAQTVSWSSSGDTHTGTVSLPDDGDYTLTMQVTDMAGNVSADNTEYTVHVDGNDPAVKVAGYVGADPDDRETTLHNESAHNDRYITMEVTLSDKYYTQAGTEIDAWYYAFDETEQTVVEKHIDFEDWTAGSITTGSDGVMTQVFTLVLDDYTDLAQDGVYHVRATQTDQSGRTNGSIVVLENDEHGREVEQSILLEDGEMRFSVNRFGSSYDVNAVTGEYITKQYNISVADIEISEINVTAIDPGELQVTLSKNLTMNELAAEEDFDTVSDEYGTEWHEYTYQLHDELFADNAAYIVALSSVDAAGNRSESDSLQNRDGEEFSISFVVDNEPPQVVVTNLESGKQYNAATYTVVLDASDNAALQDTPISITAYDRNGDTLYEIPAEDVTDNGDGTYSFDMGENNQRQTVSIVCKDKAGNETAVEVENVTVSTSFWVRFYNNKPAFFGTIAGVAAVCGLLVFVLIKRRNRKDEE